MTNAIFSRIANASPSPVKKSGSSPGIGAVKQRDDLAR